MKRIVFSVAIVLLFVPPLFAIQTNLIDDVIRMTRSGVASDTIIEFVKTSREQIEVSADDIIAMKNAGVAPDVIRAVIARGDSTGDSANAAPSSQPADQPPASGEPSDQTAASDPGGCVTFEPPISLLFPWSGVFYPPQLWDPYWYQPRLDAGSTPPATRARTNGSLGGPLRPAGRSIETADRGSREPSPARASGHNGGSSGHNGGHNSSSRRK
jgi:hypothetical protein